ncbi:PA-phosphatase [Fulvivirga sp. 29W222]|uniref:PA-phosphatase n=1 Tax=Fulvivirga marina TaxID=2494733 RepID=A0A937KC53_9BACT|nr:PA-phosphatase [Fulvivirga marina]MBL6447137.1 PA-phosphatase [Fulvivirga marina]
MLKSLANIISVVFHPLLMTTLLVASLYFFAPSSILPINSNSILLILLMVVILTYILPMLSVGMLKLTKSISSIQLKNRKERIMPFFFITVYYGVTSYFFSERLVLGNALVIMLASITATIFLITVISMFFKISAHAAGTAGILGFFVAIHFRYLDSLLFWPIIAALVLHGVVSSARLYLHTHSPKEVHFGALLGFIVNFGAAYIFT